MIWLLLLAATFIFLASTSGVVSEPVTSELDSSPAIIEQNTYIPPFIAEEPALLNKAAIIEAYNSIDPIVSISPVVKEPEAFTPPVEVAPKVLIKPASTFIPRGASEPLPIYI